MNQHVQGVKVSVSVGLQIRAADVVQNKTYVIRQRSTGLYLSNYDDDLNYAFFEANSAEGATWISEKCIDGICDKYLSRSQDDIEVIEAPDRRMYR